MWSKYFYIGYFQHVKFELQPVLDWIFLNHMQRIYVLKQKMQFAIFTFEPCYGRNKTNSWLSQHI